MYQIPLLDIVSNVLLVTLILFEYHKEYLYLKILAFISKFCVSFRDDFPSPNVTFSKIALERPYKDLSPPKCFSLISCINFLFIKLFQIFSLNYEK